MSENKIKVLFINHEGAGFADSVEIDAGTTVEQFFKDQMEGRAASECVIRVNERVTASDRVLQSGDTVTFTPAKISGQR